MDFVFVSMPYARFDSKWFANVPNINLGMLNGLLPHQGRSVKSFHFHMEYMSHVKQFGADIERKFINLSHKFGVEYLSLDYVFASLLYPDSYLRSRHRLAERLGPIGLTLNDFEVFREVATSFITTAFFRLEPYLKQTRLVGFSCSHYQLGGSLLMSSKIKQAVPQLPIVVGGKDVAGPFSRQLKGSVEHIDFVALGECEVTVPTLLDYIEGKERHPSNVIYKDEAGRIREPRIEENASLEAFPFPEYDYEALPLPLNEIILPLELGRGCPWGKCTFCPDQAYNIRCQSKTAERVAAELDHYREISPDLRNFFILDSDALKQPDTIVELSKHLEGKGCRFHFAEFRAERMNRKVVKALLDFGEWITPFQVGIETFSDHVLQVMKKGVHALKNVEVLKLVAEMGIPLQFNLFTCYPDMTTEDMNESLRIMDSIIHILVCENIQFFPGEFYLPADCPIFTEIDHYKVQKSSHSLFADMFEGFPMPGFSNYPYAYAFDNHEEQFRMAGAIRKQAERIHKKTKRENFMYYKEEADTLRIQICRDGQKRDYTLQGMEKEIYLCAIEHIRQVKDLPEELGLSPDTVHTILDDFQDKGLILYASDKKTFLSLAMYDDKR